jgi:hypothetical protein
MLAALAVCRGQPAPSPEDKKEANSGATLQELVGKSSWLDLGLDYRLRYETQDVRYRAGEEGGDQQLAHRTRFRFGIRKVLDPLRFFFEFEDARVNLADSGSTVNNTHVRKLGVLQLHVKLVSESLFGRGLKSELQFGRVTMDLGRRRLVARNVFRNTTSRFDGVRWIVGAPDRWELQSFLVRPLLYSAPDLSQCQRHGYFWGAYFQRQAPARLKQDFYYLHLYENRDASRQPKRDLKTFGARLYANPANGGWQYEYESAWQFGRCGGLKAFGHLQNVEAGHRWSSAWQPLVLFQYTYSSGDRDPLDDRLGRFDPLFGARRFDLAPTGTYALFTRSNLNSPAWRVSVRPAKPVELFFVHRIGWLAQSRDEWRGTSQRDRTGASGSHLGHHFESFLRWKLIGNSDFEVGYARFAPGTFVERQAAAGGRGSNYFWVMNEFQF